MINESRVGGCFILAPLAVEFHDGGVPIEEP